MMATRTVTYKRCDGCHKSDLFDGAEFGQSRHKHDEPEFNTIDICVECEELERYICRLCWRVHDDDNSCEWVMREQQRWATYAQKQVKGAR
jgi:hypothetical protein